MTVPYAEQIEICQRLLGAIPDLTFKAAEALFREQYKTTLTQTNFAQARERLGGRKVQAKLTNKVEYILALFSLYPKLLASEVNRKTLDYYDEETRSDVLERWRLQAKGSPVPADEARALIARVEATRASRPSLLDGPPIGEESPAPADEPGEALGPPSEDEDA